MRELEHLVGKAKADKDELLQESSYLQKEISRVKAEKAATVEDARPSRGMEVSSIAPTPRLWLRPWLWLWLCLGRGWTQYTAPLLSCRARSTRHRRQSVVGSDPRRRT